MTEEEKLRFTLSHTIQVAGQIYAATLGEDGVRKMTVEDCASARQCSVRHAIALVGDTIDIVRRNKGAK